MKDASNGPQRHNTKDRRKKSKSSIDGTMESFKQTGTNPATLMQGPLEHNNLTYDNAMGLDEMHDSPRAAFKRARDRSVRELSESFHASRSRSPASNRLQSYVDLETASPHHHTG